jgi:hypothetical protein
MDDHMRPSKTEKKPFTREDFLNRRQLMMNLKAAVNVNTGQSKRSITKQLRTTNKIEMNL